MPRSSDYNDAVQAPHVTFISACLKRGTPAELDRFGVPKVYSGNFACVYKMDVDGKAWAVRLYLNRPAAETVQRYGLLKGYLENKKTGLFADFEYQPDGILVGGQKWPVIKMEWISGKRLDSYVKEHINRSELLLELAIAWAKAIVELKTHGIAHGDLQHGNVLVVDKAIKLVDYDAVYCGDTKHLICRETGMPNYQHPMRRAEHYGPEMDNFSAWIIYLSLITLTIDPSLLSDNTDALVFEESDYVNPAASKALKLMCSHRSEDIREVYQVAMSQVFVSDIAKVAPFDPAAVKACGLHVILGGNKKWWVQATDKIDKTWLRDWTKKKP